MKKKIERILDNLEKMIATFFVALLGIISYYVVNIDKLLEIQEQLVYIGIFVVLTILVLLCLCYKKLLDRID